MAAIIQGISLDDLERRLETAESTIGDLKEAIKAFRHNEGTTKNPIHAKESDLTRTEREKIADILRDFDFKKVHDVMHFLDWKWMSTKNRVPSVDEIRSEAHRLLVDAANEKTCIATGGLRAVYEKGDENDPEPFIGLEFIVEDCEGFDDE